MDQTKRNIETLFSKADNMSLDKVDAKFKAIMKKSEKAVDLSGIFSFTYDYNKIIINLLNLESKIQLVTHMQEILSKYMAKLDKDIFKCKIELEDGHSGSTEIIEKSKN